MHKSFTKRKSHQIHRCRGAGSEHNLFPGSGIQKSTYLVTGLLISIGREGSKPMDRTMNIGVAGLYQLIPALNHLLRPLSRSRVVQIHQRLPVHFTGQGGEVTAYF